MFGSGSGSVTDLKLIPKEESSCYSSIETTQLSPWAQQFKILSHPAENLSSNGEQNQKTKMPECALNIPKVAQEIINQLGRIQYRFKVWATDTKQNKNEVNFRDDEEEIKSLLSPEEHILNPELLAIPISCDDELKTVLIKDIESLNKKLEKLLDLTHLTYPKEEDSSFGSLSYFSCAGKPDPQISETGMQKNIDLFCEDKPRYENLVRLVKHEAVKIMHYSCILTSFLTGNEVTFLKKEDKERVFAIVKHLISLESNSEDWLIALKQLNSVALSFFSSKTTQKKNLHSQLPALSSPISKKKISTLASLINFAFSKNGALTILCLVIAGMYFRIKPFARYT